MIKTVEVSAKRLEDAISDALKQLGVSKDDADVEILSQGGIFSKAKVRVSAEVAEPKREAPKAEVKPEVKPQPAPVGAKRALTAQEKPASKPDKKEAKAETKTEKKADKKEVKADKKPVDKPASAEARRAPAQDKADKKPIEGDGGAREFLEGILSRMGVTANVEISLEGDRMTINLDGNDNALIGSRGETLSSLRYLTSLVVNSGGAGYVYVDLDSGDYRARRVETLQRLAAKTADRALRAGRKVKLEPMPSSDRRIIHAALQDRTDVVCRSEGKEPRRAIAIMPARSN